MREGFDRFGRRRCFGGEAAGRQNIGQARTDLARHPIDRGADPAHLGFHRGDTIAHLRYHRYSLIVLGQNLVDVGLRRVDGPQATLQFRADRRTDEGQAFKLGSSTAKLADGVIDRRQHLIGTAPPRFACGHQGAEPRLQLIHVGHGTSLDNMGSVVQLTAGSLTDKPIEFAADNRAHFLGKLHGVAQPALDGKWHVGCERELLVDLG
ncbi:hypothetical protein D3C79_807650 [compost metagenome]